jgi:hypothetical protein
MFVGLSVYLEPLPQLDSRQKLNSMIAIRCPPVISVAMLPCPGNAGADANLHAYGPCPPLSLSTLISFAFIAELLMFRGDNG